MKCFESRPTWVRITWAWSHSQKERWVIRLSNRGSGFDWFWGEGMLNIPETPWNLPDLFFTGVPPCSYAWRLILDKACVSIVTLQHRLRWTYLFKQTCQNSIYFDYEHTQKGPPLCLQMGKKKPVKYEGMMLGGDWKDTPSQLTDFLLLTDAFITGLAGNNKGLKMSQDYIPFANSLKGSFAKVDFRLEHKAVLTLKDRNESGKA